VKLIQTLRTDTREGFRLLVAWVAGFLSFAVLSSIAERVILYAKPWQAEASAHSEAEQVLLFSLIGLGLIAVAGALILEGLKLPGARDLL
jgi:hypothetical protein